MTADLVDPWDLPAPVIQQLSLDTVDTMIGNIHADVARSEHNDPPLQAQLLSRTLTELRTATQGVDEVAVWAGHLLSALWHRSQCGVPDDEPAEPAWSLDSEERHIPGSERR